MFQKGHTIRNGTIPWNKGKTGVYTQEVRDKMGLSMKGKKHSPETIRQYSLMRKGRKLTENWKRSISLGHNPMQIPPKERIRIRNLETKKKILDHYGWKCACCGESTPQFLTIDHVNNDGYKDTSKSGRRFTGYHLYSKIVKDNFPSKYQILCSNCNHGKNVNNGVCPHVAIL